MKVVSTFNNSIYKDKKANVLEFNKSYEMYNNLFQLGLDNLKNIQKTNNKKSFILFETKNKVYEMQLQLFTDNQTLTLVKHNYIDNIKETFYFYYYNKEVFIKYIIYKASNPAYVIKDEDIFGHEESDVLDIKVKNDNNLLLQLKDIFEELSVMVD